MPMNYQLQAIFDRHFDEVLADMPEPVHRLLDDVAMFVEDYPSADVMRRTGVRHRRQLCGLYTGIPLTNRSIEHSGVLSDAVYIYREGILSLAMRPDGTLDEQELRKQIRITVLHELGHHHGLGERELRELGY
jgi:predicted Zn-dependent protease with MMP-like domain